MPLRLGIEIACRAAHQVSLADEEGRFIWTGRRFHTTPQDLARLSSMLPDGTDPAEVLVVMEPTRNAWAPLAAWFRRSGARVVLVPPERSADLPDRGNLRLPRHRREPGCDRLLRRRGVRRRAVPIHRGPPGNTDVTEPSALLEVADGLAHLRLNRPQVRNALHAEDVA
jgi:hypothetical protein